MSRRGYATWRVDKEPGGHVTATRPKCSLCKCTVDSDCIIQFEITAHVVSWWLYARLALAAPSASVVQFGVTDYADVNPTPHMWARGGWKKTDYLGQATELLRNFLRGRIWIVLQTPLIKGVVTWPWPSR